MTSNPVNPPLDSGVNPPASRAVGAAVSSRQRFRAACRCLPVDRPPVWLMRQAGRALPEYRELKLNHTFLELVQTPDLAVEVTLQPIRRFGFDAAILFSDILVIPEAMGQGYHFRDQGGIQMDFAIRTQADIERLSVDAVCERLCYVEAALRLLRAELADKTALIGFSGSPWTLATFMMEGGSSPAPQRALELFRSERETFNLLMDKLTAAIAAYLKMQAACGVDALQIFDSHGGMLSAAEFPEASGRWIKQLVAEIEGQPSPPSVIVFSLGTHDSWPGLVDTGADVLGVDWNIGLSEVRRQVVSGVALQGNLRPAVLVDGTPESVAADTREVLEAMRGRPGHIFNLGHGVPPSARLENIQALVETVKEFQS